MKHHWLFLSASILILMTACLTASKNAAPDLSNVAPGEKVVVSQAVLLKGFPNAVIPNSTKPAIRFSNLKLSKNGDFIDGDADFVRVDQQDFVIIAILSAEKEMLYGYFDPDTNLTFHLPSGTVLLGIQGGKVTSAAQGSIHFSLNGKVWNGYDFFGESGDAYLFSVPGSVNPRSSLPGDQSDINTFQANSNVVKIHFSLK